MFARAVAVARHVQLVGRKVRPLNPNPVRSRFTGPSNRCAAAAKLSTSSKASTVSASGASSSLLRRNLNLAGAPQRLFATAAQQQEEEEEEEEDNALDSDSESDSEDEEDEETPQTSSSVTPDGVRVVVRKRLLKGSYKKFNLLTRLVAGRYALDALEQMAFNKKRKALIMRNLINLGAVRALQDHNIPIERLKVELAIVNKGPIAKRARFHARGRVGKNYHRYSHLRLTFAEAKEMPATAQHVPQIVHTWSARPKVTNKQIFQKRQSRRAKNVQQNADRLNGQVVETGINDPYALYEGEE